MKVIYKDERKSWRLPFKDDEVLWSFNKIDNLDWEFLFLLLDLLALVFTTFVLIGVDVLLGVPIDLFEKSAKRFYYHRVVIDTWSEFNILYK